MSTTKRTIEAACFLLLMLVIGCSGTQQNLATGDDFATFVPVVTDYGVDIFVDQVDGKPTKFGELDSATIDAGTHDLSIRLEYQPAAGSSVVVGGLANLLLRAGTNKTFRTTVSVTAEAGHVYQVSARASEGDSLTIFIIDETLDKGVLNQTFTIKDGRFERVF